MRLGINAPTCAHTVPSADIRGWRRSSDELFQIAADNVRADPDAPEIVDFDLLSHRASADVVIA